MTEGFHILAYTESFINLSKLVSELLAVPLGVQTTNEIHLRQQNTAFSLVSILGILIPFE